jgi:hypothetical protein
MHSSRTVLALAFVTSSLTFVACGGAVQSIEMKGGDPDLASIAGDWKGKYEGLDTGRTGDIQFSLELGRHTADGQVFMGGSHTPLSIRFVQVQRDQISGEIDPYIEPSCACQVHTQFLGSITGNQIDGTFTTTVSMTGGELHGTWHVTRAGT